MAEENTEEVAKGGKGKIIVIAVGAIVLLAAGIFAGPMVQKMLGGEAAETAETGEEAAEAPPRKDAIYQGIHPPLLINFVDERGKGRFLQISLELLTHEQAVVEAIKTHSPVIRNNLILLYGDIQFADVSTREGKAKMLDMALAEINKVLEEQTGEQGVEAVYFTNLVVQ